MFYLTIQDDVHSQSCESVKSSEHPEKPSLPALDSLKPPTIDRRKVSECDSTGSRERWKRYSTTEEIYGDMDGLKQHCTLISENYFRCFVTGL